MDQGVAVWVTGANDEMVQRVADAVHQRLVRRHLHTELLTPSTPGVEAIAGPGMDRRAGFVVKTLVRHGIVVVVAVPSASRAAREAIRAAVGRMIEVHVPVGGTAGYEAPVRAEVQVDFPETELPGAVERTMRTLEVLGYLRPGDDPSYSAEEERQVIRRLKSFGYL